MSTCWISKFGRVSTHSRPKAAGYFYVQVLCQVVGFNTQPPEGGWMGYRVGLQCFSSFQHTAARRRLAAPKTNPVPTQGFNTQPPEGGWLCSKLDVNHFGFVSTHSRPKAAGGA